MISNDERLQNAKIDAELAKNRLTSLNEQLV